MTGLAGMAAHAAKRVARLKIQEPVETLRGRVLYGRTPLDPARVLAAGARIVEVRFAGPESGLLVAREKATAEEAARQALAAFINGVDGVGVWVERNFHAGDHGHLEAARAACPKLFLIARDLVVDPWQLERARAAGADAVELYPDVLGPALPTTAAAVRALGLLPVVWTPGPTVRAL